LERLTRLSPAKATLESSLSALNTSLRRNLTVAQVAAHGLAGVMDFLGAPMGALFVVEGVGARLETLRQQLAAALTPFLAQLGAALCPRPT
jgi:hypothetical protein